jgi:hypothetical protein
MIATTHETSSRLRVLTRLGFWGSVIGGLLFPWAIMLAVEVVVHQVPVSHGPGDRLPCTSSLPAIISSSSAC